MYIADLLHDKNEKSTIMLKNQTFSIVLWFISVILFEKNTIKT